MSFPLRKLTPSDYDDLIALWKRCGLPYRPEGRDTREAIAGQMQRPDTFFRGMFDRDMLIGSVIGDSSGRKGWINRLAVHPDYRGKGLAAVLIKECEEFFKGLGLKVIGALIEEDNESSFSAFRKSGYAPAKNIIYWTKKASDKD